MAAGWLLAATVHAAPAESDAGSCVPVGSWVMPPSGDRRDDAVRVLAARNVVLLGESHEDAEHHRWQLHTIAALHAQRPGLVLAFEMFPRRVQPVLDRWSRGELGEAEFLREVGWSQVWGFEAGLYLPMFHFARMHRLPMLALNVERATVRAVSTRGLAALAGAEREGVGEPAPAGPRYRERLLEAFRQHANAGDAGADSERFERFVEAQVFWDRAMAEVIARAATADPRPLVVGIMGQGHVEYRDGVAHQLAALGVEAGTALPWPAGSGCTRPDPDVADLVFGVAPAAAPASSPPRLGVMVAAAEGGVRIDRIVPQSIAEAAGLQVGDIIREAAGRSLRQPGDLVAVIRRQAAGTWLPLSVRRGEETREVVARFPAEP
jgi:uncharacterized iron-regulated protein